MTQRSATIFQTAVLLITLASLARLPEARGQAAGQDPTVNPELRLDEAIRKLDNDDLEGARIEYLQALRGIRRDEPKLKLVEGLLQLKLKPPNVTEALLALEEYNKSTPGRNDYRGHAAIGRVYKDSRRYLLASGPLLTAKGLAPRELVNGKNIRADITLDLAMVYHGLKRHKMALDEAKEAEQLAGGDPEIQLRLAEVALGGDDYETAIQAADKAINLYRTRIKTSPLEKPNYRALLNAHQFKISTGMKQAEKDPKNPVPTLNVAITVQQLGDVHRILSLVDSREIALQALRKEQADARTTIQIKLFLANLEAALGAFSDADEHIAEVLRDDPENAQALELRRKLSGGQ
jgi:tetratricopeptide (TPR) repeat protein